jgi:hypothetical protein
MRGDRSQIIGVMIHVVSVAGLTRASVTSAVVRDDAIALI